MSSEADKLIELAQQLFPPPRPKERVVMRTYYDTSPMPVEQPGERLLIIELVPLTAPERPDDPGSRTYGEPKEDDEPGLSDDDALEKMLERMANGEANL